MGGVDVAHDREAVGHSDADVLLHAVTDALLGAAALGDIGQLFPNTDEVNRDRDSAEMLTEALARLRQAGLSVVNVDCIVFAQRPNLGEQKTVIQKRIAELLEVAPDCVGIKAKTGEGVGPIGREEAISAQCVALISR